MAGKTTAIVTGASQGIGAAVVQAFLDRGYNVVATSRGISEANFAPSPHLALVDGGHRSGSHRRQGRTNCDRVRLDQSCRQQRGHLRCQVFYRLRHRRVSSFRLHQPGRVHLHNPTRSQANAVAGYGWQRDKHHDVVRR
jgi:hypothetical protein